MAEEGGAFFLFVASESSMLKISPSSLNFPTNQDKETVQNNLDAENSV